MRKLFRWVLPIAFLLQLAACSPEATAPEATAPKADCKLTMGWDPWPPYHYVTAGGELAGFDIELLRAMTAEAGCELEFERDSWATLLGRLGDGSIDLVTGATITTARQEFARFSAPIRSEEFALFVRTAELSKWDGADLRDLMARGLRLGITDAYVYGDAVEAVLNDPAYTGQLTDAHFGEVLTSLLLDAEIDAFIENDFAAAAIIRRLGLEAEISRHPLTLGPGTDVHIMYSKSTVTAELATRLDRSLAKLRESGEYDELRRHYLE